MRLEIAAAAGDQDTPRASWIAIGSLAVGAVALVTVWGFSLGMQAIAMQSWLQCNAPGGRDAMQALFVSLTQAATGAGALAGGVVVDKTGTSGAMLFGGVASLVTLAMALLQRRHVRRHPSPTPAQEHPQ